MHTAHSTRAYLQPCLYPQDTIHRPRRQVLGCVEEARDAWVLPLAIGVAPACAACRLPFFSGVGTSTPPTPLVALIDRPSPQDGVYDEHNLLGRLCLGCLIAQAKAWHSTRH